MTRTSAFISAMYTAARKGPMITGRLAIYGQPRANGLRRADRKPAAVTRGFGERSRIPEETGDGSLRGGCVH